MGKDYGKYLHPKTVSCMNVVLVYGFMDNPVIDALLYIKFSVGYCEITFAVDSHTTIKSSKETDC
jgi:hypothetical protein